MSHSSCDGSPNAQLERANAFITQSQQAQAGAALASLTKTVDNYFGAADMEPYHDHTVRAAGLTPSRPLPVPKCWKPQIS